MPDSQLPKGFVVVLVVKFECFVPSLTQKTLNMRMKGKKVVMFVTIFKIRPKGSQHVSCWAIASFLYLSMITDSCK